MLTLRPHQQKALTEMTRHSNGQLIMPTAAGKTYVMVADAMEQLKSGPKTFVVVAPRILLATQLCEDFMQFLPATWVHVCHAHSGKNDYFNSTKAEKIALFNNTARAASESCIIFTTYNSLKRIVESGIKVDTVYFDEAHNSVKKSFYPPTKQIVSTADRSYHFTATPKHSAVFTKAGMNDYEVYGNIIMNVPAPELIDNGSILPPMINPIVMNMERDKEYGAERDCMTLLDTIINGDNMQKVLVASPNTKVLIRMLAETDFMPEVQSYGYDILWITAKYGAFINNNKVTRKEFFDTLTAYGKDSDKKFIVLHYSILSEGINCPGLTACVMMRQMDMIQMCQTIGRVIRLHPEDAKNIRDGKVAAGDLNNYEKPFGLIHVPVYSNVGISTARRLQNIVDTVFVQGKPIISTIKR